jgi:hypothetical protein
VQEPAPKTPPKKPVAPAKEVVSLVKNDIKSLGTNGVLHPDNNNHSFAFDNGSVPEEDEKNAPYKAVWDKRFGDVYVKEWSEFIVGLKIPISAEESSQLRTIIDYSRTGSVTRYKFIEFLKGFGPLERCVENVKRVVASDWFHGFISANESKKFLEQQPVGTFLIRFSGSRPGAFVLDYVREIGHVRSVRLKSHISGGFAAQGERPGAKELIFKSLEDLVDTYRKMGVLTLPFSSSLTSKPWFYGDVTADEAELLLQGQPAGTFLIRFSGQRGHLAASYVGPQTAQSTNGMIRAETIAPGADLKVQKGLITKHAAGWQVGGAGMVFGTVDELIVHYQEQKIFTQPFQQ